MKTSVQQVNIVKVGEATSEQPDLLAVEEPLEIRLGYGSAGDRQQRANSVTMRTPGHDFDLALGFLFTEGIIKRYEEVESINQNPDHVLAADEFLMMTIRSHDQYNTTIYGMHNRYRGIHHHRRVVLMNEKDMAAAKLKNEDVVDLVSVYDGVERLAEGFLAIVYPIPEQCVATYFPEANVLIPFNRAARKSNQPISKSMGIKIRRCGNAS